MPEVKDPNLLAMLNGGGGAPAPRGPISSGVKAPAPPTPIDLAKEQRDAQEFQWKQQEAARKAAEEASKAEGVTITKTNAADSVRVLLKQLKELEDDAKDNSGWGETGSTGALMRSAPIFNNAGKDLAGKLEPIKGSNAFTALAGLAEQGIKLTPISNAEIALAASSIANLNPDLSQEEFLAQIQTAREKYKATLKALDPSYVDEDAAKPDEDALKAKFPEAARFLYSKGELVGYEDASGDFVAVVDNLPQPPEGGGGGGLGQALYAGVGDVAQGVGDTLGLVGNPLNAGINAIAGTNLSTDLGQTFRDATGAPRGNALASAINQGGVGAMTGAGLANAAARGGGGYIANALASQPVQQVAGGVTAGAAAEGARQAGASAPVQIGAGLLGGVLGFGGANALMTAARPTSVAPVAQAAARQGVEMLPADVGGATTRRLTSAAAQAPLSAAPITAAAERSSASFGQATQRASQGSRLAPDEAGAIVVKAGERFNKQSRETGGKLYDRAGKMAQGVSIKAKGAIATIDEQIADLSQAKEVNAPLISALERFKADLSNNQGIKVSGMRDLRTAAQKAAYTEDMRSTPAQRVLAIVANAIGDDINAGLQQAGRGNAAQAFKTADSYWKDRVEYIDKVLEPVIGKGKSGEAVLGAVEQMAQGKGKGVQNLMKLMRSVDKEELSDIQATIIDRMGKSSAGAQNAEGSAYSASTFLTNWNKMSGKGKAALFPNQEVRKNLNELAMIADNMKQASKYANTSNTAGGIMGQVAITGGLGVASPTALILGSAAQYLSGRALSSPRLTAWLAKVPANPQAQAAHVKRLDAIAAAEPIIANDIASIKQFLANAPTSSRAAASDQVSEERPIQP